MKLAIAVATVALAAGSLAAVPVVPAVAAPGGDTFVVVQPFTLVEDDRQITVSAMCPGGTRALGGGVSVDTLPSLEQYLRIFYSAPLDSSGLASQTDAGDIPRGWMVSVGHYDGVQDDAYRLFVTCSATSDAVLATEFVGGSGAIEGTAMCPGGMRAVGGGVGKVGDTVIPSDTQGPYLQQTGPVDSSGTVAATVTGDIPVGWRTATVASPYGNRFFAVCSASSDAVVATAAYTVAAGPAVGSATATCPAGRRVLSGGDQVDGAIDADDRLGRLGPYASGQMSQVTTGSVARSWTSSARGPLVSRNHTVYAVCATDTPPVDTLPPDTTIKKGPDKKTFKTKAKFVFSAEAGSTFTCKVDKKKAKACTSPYKVKNIKPGKHKVTITATDSVGNVETKPATYRWKLLKAPVSGCTGECRAGAD